MHRVHFLASAHGGSLVLGKLNLTKNALLQQYLTPNTVYKPEGRRQCSRASCANQIRIEMIKFNSQVCLPLCSNQNNWPHRAVRSFVRLAARLDFFSHLDVARARASGFRSWPASANNEELLSSAIARPPLKFARRFVRRSQSWVYLFSGFVYLLLCSFINKLGTHQSTWCGSLETINLSLSVHRFLHSHACRSTHVVRNWPFFLPDWRRRWHRTGIIHHIFSFTVHQRLECSRSLSVSCSF